VPPVARLVQLVHRSLERTHGRMAAVFTGRLPDCYRNGTCSAVWCRGARRDKFGVDGAGRSRATHTARLLTQE